MRAMHFAVDRLNLDTIFPMSDGSLPTMDNPSALKKCLDELKGSELNKTQQDAITSMLDPACRQVHVHVQCRCQHTNFQHLLPFSMSDSSQPPVLEHWMYMYIVHDIIYHKDSERVFSIHLPEVMESSVPY